jgi:twitching motility protein PilT
VFGTLHTATAVSTIDRVIALFPPIQQESVRATLAESLRGVIAQSLLRKIGGGRVAALEVLVTNAAIANLIREGKNHMIAGAMQMGKKFGNSLLNEELARLVCSKAVELNEALSKSLDKADLQGRIDKGG